MINVAVISPNEATLEALAASVADIAGDSILQLKDYPDPNDMDRLLAALGEAVVLLDFADYKPALKLAKKFDACGHKPSPIAVFTSAPSSDALMALMQVGIRHVITAPFRREELCAGVLEVVQSARRDPTAVNGEIYSFLPAKPGSGATTVCTSVAAAAARLGDRQVLLLDFDLKLGVTSFLLKLHNDHSVIDALSNSKRLDHALWKQLVGQREQLDILGSAPAQVEQHFNASDYGLVLNHAQQTYHKTCVDLPGTMDDYEIDTLRRSAQIFLLCTADVAGLHMARRKTSLLTSLQVGTPVSVVLNFAGRRGTLSAGEIEQIVQAPVRFTLPSDERAVADAVREGAPIREKSPLGKELEKIARQIAIARADEHGPMRAARRFVEYFSISRERKAQIWK